MKTITLIFLMCVSLLTYADVYKCVQSGKTIYSSSPCGESAQIIQRHITSFDEAPHRTLQYQNIETTQPREPVVVKVSQVSNLVSGKTTKINCEYQDAELESVKKAMRAGYPDSLSNYWHERFRNANNAIDLCKKKLRESKSE
ncbi:MAG: hypothetical protein ABL902_04325 [Gallionella sp.]